MKNKKNLLCTLILAGLLSASMVGCGGLIEDSDSFDSTGSTNSEVTSDGTSETTSEENNSSSDGEAEVTHKAYEEIEGEPVRVVAPIAEGNVKGYSVKICPCGEELQGDFTVLVTVKLNGAELATQTVKVGAGLAEVVLPTREGYTLKLYKNGEVAYTYVVKAYNTDSTANLELTDVKTNKTYRAILDYSKNDAIRLTIGEEITE